MLIALPASAQTIVTLASQEDLEEAGIFSSTKEELPGGTLIVQSEAGSLRLAYDDEWGKLGAYQQYRVVKVGESSEITLGSGVAGNTNPTFVSYQQGAPTAGAVFEIRAERSGWMTVFTKLNPNKQYWVFEGKNRAVAYTLGVSNGTYSINYKLPSYTTGPDAGLIDFSSADNSGCFTLAHKQMTNESGEPLWYDRYDNIVAGKRPVWTDGDGVEQVGKPVQEEVPGEYLPQFPFLVAGMTSTTGDGTGFLTFKVRAGNTYYVSGLGTKMACQGFIFTEGDEEPAVTFCATEELPEVRFQTGLTLPDVTSPTTPGVGGIVVDRNSTIVLASRENLEDAGLSFGKTDIPGGTLIVNSEAGSLYLAFDDSWCMSNSYSHYQNVKVGNTEEIALGIGAVGNTNPVFVSYQQGAPTAGAVFEINAKKNGWMTVFTKMNPNKQYIVFEGNTKAVPYTLGVAGDGYKINYTLPSYSSGPDAGLIDFSSAAVSRYFRTAQKPLFNDLGQPLWYDENGNIVAGDRPEWSNDDGSVQYGERVLEEVPGEYAPQFPYIVADLPTPPGISTGFLTFKVKAGNTYYVSGLGTKMVCQGFILTESDEEPPVTFCATEELPEVKFEIGYVAPSFAVGDKFESDGIEYAVTGTQPKTCAIMHGALAGIENVVVPAEVTFKDEVFSVVAVGEDCFRGSEVLRSVTLPSTVVEIGTGAFEDCKRLTSLVWQARSVVPGRVVKEIGNPNLLLYVDDLNYASESQGCIVVANGVCESLELTPGYPFTPVRTFTANRSRMVKEFTQKTYIGVCAGWESIVLPFDVTEVYAENLASSLTPMESVGEDHRLRPYWLYEGDATGDWTPASSIKAGVPYIISTPNNSAYPDIYNVNGPVVFSNDQPQRITPETTAPYQVDWASGRQFRSLWLPLSETEAATAMGLNVEISGMTDDEGNLLPPGSVFHVGVTPKPLEAYVTRLRAERAMKVMGGQSAVLPVIADGSLEMRVTDGRLCLRSTTDRTVHVFAPDGTSVRVLELKAGVTANVDDLTPGIYIAAGRKVIVR